MDFDVSRIDGGRSVHPGGSRQRIKDIGPDPLTAPAIEAIIDRRVRSVDFRAITPARPTSEHIDDPADHTAIVDAMSPFPPPWQQRFYPPPFRIAEPVDLLCHSSLPSAEKLESQSLFRWNPYWVQTLDR